MEYDLINIRTKVSDGKGQLSFFEAEIDVPFPIKRIYYTYGVPAGEKRGGHAHRNLRQLLVCPTGRIEIILFDGVERANIILDNPSKGLLISNMTWRDMIWQEEGSILMVAASDYYNEADYIRDYDMFLKCVSADSAERGFHE